MKKLPQKGSRAIMLRFPDKLFRKMQQKAIACDESMNYYVNRIVRDDVYRKAGDEKQR